ncbi:unnamed protein product, partial [Tetraodon nigroviridis]
MAKENTPGRLESIMKGYSTRTTVTVRAFTAGPQATNSRVSSFSTGRKDTDITSSLMGPAFRLICKNKRSKTLPSQGLYQLDHRFGPGVMSYPNGCMDVGLWVGKHLHKLCDVAEESFSLQDFPEYAAYVDPRAPVQRRSAEDHSLLLTGKSGELDGVPLGDLREADVYQGEPGPGSSLTLQARMETHIHKHRLAAETLSWDVGAVLALNRDGFGPKGPLEAMSEQLIQRASHGDLQAVSKIIRTGLVHPDVADSRGNTALIVATVNYHHDVLHLLLDVGADIDKLNGEGMSALAVCHLLYYPFRHLPAVFMPAPGKTQVRFHLMPFFFFLSDICRMDFAGFVSLKCVSCQILESPEISQADPPKPDPALSSQGCLSEQYGDAVIIVLYLFMLMFKPCFVASTGPRLLQILSDLGWKKRMQKNEKYRAGLIRHVNSGKSKGLYPLHVAAALPGPAGPEITEMLLHTVQDPDARAYDQDETFDLDKVYMKAQWGRDESTELKEGGRTALHVACQRAGDHQNATKVVALLLSHRASTDLLWSGHSPLSLAIATGNILAVEELLNGGADPNTPLGPGVGSALCAFANIHYTLDDRKETLLQMLVRAGADILMPVLVDGDVGTAMDYAYHSFHQVKRKTPLLPYLVVSSALPVSERLFYPFKFTLFASIQDVRISGTPFNALSPQEQELFKARCRLLCMMGDLMRQAAHQRELENLAEKERRVSLSYSERSQTFAIFSRGLNGNLKTVPKFCYYCGRSVLVRLTPCYRCYKVFYCSRPCRLRAWDELHKNEC